MAIVMILPEAPAGRRTVDGMQRRVELFVGGIVPHEASFTPSAKIS